MRFTYKVTEHPGVTHLVYDGTKYRLDALTEAQKRFLYGTTPFIQRSELTELPAADVAPVEPTASGPPRRARKAR